MTGDLEAHRKVNLLNRCPKCDDALDTGYECTGCGYDAAAHAGGDRVLTAEKLAEAAAEAKARGAVAPKSRWA